MSRENVELVKDLQPQTGLALLFRDDRTAAATIEAATVFFEPDFESVFVQPVEY